MTIESKAKILGLWIGMDCVEEWTYSWNFMGILDKIQKVCDSWHHRTHSLKGKVTVANSLLISLLQYPCSTLPTPARVFKEFRNIISRFLWNNKKARISYQAFIQSIARGGLRLFDLETRVKASLLQWIKRVLTRPHTNINMVLRYLLDTDDLNSTLAYRAPTLPSALKSHRFYHNTLKTYLSSHNDEPIDENSIRREILWFNPQVGGKKSPLHWPRWEKTRDIHGGGHLSSK